MTKPKDRKEALSSRRKPDLTHLRTGFAVYAARACEYGSAKYQRANYLREVGEAPHPNRQDFERLREYLRASIGHQLAILDAMEAHQAEDPELEDVEGMKVAVYAADYDAKPDCPVGPSKLPHACGASASLVMGLQQAIQYGLLPADPGQPWAETLEKIEPATDDHALHVQKYTEAWTAWLDTLPADSELAEPELWSLEWMSDDGEWHLQQGYVDVSRAAMEREVGAGNFPASHGYRWVRS